MTRASNQPMASTSLGPAVAAPDQPVDLPPQVAVARPPSPAVNANATVNANAPPQANGQPARDPAPAQIPPAPASSAAQNLTAQLLSMQPNMTLTQLTGILDILAPDRHMRSVASNLLRSSQPLPPRDASNALRSSQQPPPPPPPTAAVPNPPPLYNPLTGPRISTPQRRAQPQAQGTSVQDLLGILNAPVRKRSEILYVKGFLNTNFTELSKIENRFR